MININAVLLGIAAGLIAFGLEWAGYDRTLTFLSTTAMIAFILGMIYRQRRRAS